MGMTEKILSCRHIFGRVRRLRTHDGRQSQSVRERVDVANRQAPSQLSSAARSTPCRPPDRARTVLSSVAG
jgi:hypothetical protein